MRITVFTPTYNRGYIIDNLYESLKRQTFRNFEWIVIDDGSTDDTEEKFTKFKKDSDFPLTYLKVNNGGKHRAINRGVQMAKGELFFIVDSDDYLTDDSLKIIDRIEKTIPNEKKKNFAGICGMKGYTKSESIGNTFDGETLDITMLERSKYGITGDKSEIFYTDILKKYPFPEFEGENFITECVVWDKIAFDGYKLRFFNEINYICDYLPDGLTAHSEQLFVNNPKGYGLYLYQSDVYGKIQCLDKWNKYFKYYNLYKSNLTFYQISKNLHMNTVVFYLRIFGLRLFYKLYDR